MSRDRWKQLNEDNPGSLFVGNYLRLDLSNGVLAQEDSTKWEKLKKIMITDEPEDVLLETEDDMIVLSKPDIARVDLMDMRDFFFPILIVNDYALAAAFNYLNDNPVGELNRNLLHPKYELQFTELEGIVFLKATPLTNYAAERMDFSFEDAVTLYNHRPELLRSMSVQDGMPRVPYTHDQCHLIMFVNSSTVEPEKARGFDGHFWGSKVHTTKYNAEICSNSIKSTRNQPGANAIFRRHRGSKRDDCRMRKYTFYLTDEKPNEFNIPHIVIYTFTRNAPLGATPAGSQSHKANKSGSLFERIDKEVAEQIAKSALSGVSIRKTNINFPHFSKDQIRRVYKAIRPKFVLDSERRFRQMEQGFAGCHNQDVSIRTLTYPEDTLHGPKLVVVASFVMTDMLKAFLHSCPTAAEICSWEAQVKAEAEKDLTAVLNNLASRADESGIDAAWGGHVYYDTTFQLSDMYLTPLLGDLRPFVNKKSKKRKKVVIGFLLHTSKKEKVHSFFFNHLSEICLKMAPTKRCSSFTSDGEQAFRIHKKEEFFKFSNHIRCNLHFLGNLSSTIARNSVLKRLLFGFESDEGFVRGAILVCSREEMHKRIRGLLDNKEISNEEHTRLMSTQELFEGHSLCPLLMSKHSVGFQTSNVAENFNKILKVCIKKNRRHADELALDVIEYAREEYHMLQHIADGESGGSSMLCIKTDFCFLDEKERRAHFDSLGMRPPVTLINFPKPLPEALFSGLNPRSRTHLIARVEKLHVKLFADFTGALIYRGDKVVSSIVANANTIRCTPQYPQTQCDRLVCDHKIAFLQAHEDATRERLIDLLVSSLRPADNLVINTDPSIGMKGRKLGNRHGAGNHSRAIKKYAPSSDKAVIPNVAEISTPTYTDDEINCVDNGGTVASHRVRKPTSVFSPK